jgi:hypothetical protein
MALDWGSDDETTAEDDRKMEQKKKETQVLIGPPFFPRTTLGAPGGTWASLRSCNPGPTRGSISTLACADLHIIAEGGTA